MATTRKIGRDAETGLFIPVEEARRRHREAVVETIPVRKPAAPAPSKPKRR